MMTNYYDENAQAFIENTVNLDMQPLYQRFLASLAPPAKILDAGCGTGRDAKYFLQQGFDITAFDASEQLVKFATKYTLLPIKQSTFLDFRSQKKFAGIWACASLLHVPNSQLVETFNHLTSYLTDKGVFYCSFKYGQNEVVRDGRTFTHLDEAMLSQLIAKTTLTIKEIWLTGDQRIGRENELWLNALLVKKAKMGNTIPC